jgi:exopolysaccharide production protein ExoY
MVGAAVVGLLVKNDDFRISDSGRNLVFLESGRSGQNPFGRRLSLAFKWLFDRVFAAAALVFFLPFFAVVAGLILLKDGRPLFFAHERVGKDGRRFKCYKFRTMVRDADRRIAEILAKDPIAAMEWKATQKLTNDPRVHCMGRFLRKTSLDELPQFFNVLRGDMSVVGPRPIVADEAVHYGEHYVDYLAMRPGITGLWQVSGRSDTSYDERVALDVKYANNRTTLQDLSIIGKTIRVVLSCAGAR